MFKIFQIIAILAVSISFSQQCVASWTNGQTYSSGSQISFNGESYTACQWVAAGDYPGSTAGVIGNSCGWNGSASVIWQSTGSCTGGTSVTILSSSSLTYSSSTIVYGNSSSSDVSSSSSSSMISSSSFEDNEAGTEAIYDRNVVKRCQISGTEENNTQACLDPQTLAGSLIRVPGNITRIDQDGLSICQIVNDETRPTAVFFILDQSGSMGNTNDLNKIADNAFEDAIDHLVSLDSTAHIGFVGFSSGTVDSTYVQPNLGTSSHVQTLKDKIVAHYGGGTEPFDALVRANTDLADPKYDDFNKAIVFLGDGAISETRENIRSAVANGVAIHGIYLNANLNDQGTSLSNMVQDAPSGTFNRITQASDILGIMENILDNIIEVQTPSSVTVTNSDLNISGTSDINSLVQQADSSWKLPLDKDIPLQPGKNNISLITNYSSNTGMTNSVPVNFQIELVDFTINDDIPITGTVFQSSCFEWAKLEIQNPKTLDEVDYVNQEFDSLTFHYQTLEPEGQGDTLTLQVTTLTYLDTIILKIPRSDIVDNLHRYFKTLPINWNVDADTDNLELELSAVDSVFVQWNHPVDARDNASAKTLVFWGLPSVAQTELYDVDGNGQLDSMAFSFNSEILPSAIPFLDWKLPWIGSNQSPIIMDNDYIQLQVDPQDSLKAYAIIDETKVGYFTGIQDSLGVLSLEHIYPGDSPLSNQTYDSITVIDYMAPVIFKAQAQVLSQKNGESQLVLNFSENIVQEEFLDIVDMRFTNQPSRFFDYDPSTVIRVENQRSVQLNYGEKYGIDFKFLPKDSLRFEPGLVQDLAGNASREDHELVPVQLELALDLEVLDFVTIDPADFVNKPKFEMQAYDLNTDVQSIMENKGAISAAIGPFRGNELDSLKTAENTSWKWSVDIFDNIGQFVAKFRGEIKCDDEAFLYEGATSCMDSDGAQFLFTWNNKTMNHRIVGSGVYIMHVRIQDQEDLLVKVGVQRQN